MSAYPGLSRRDADATGENSSQRALPQTVTRYEGCRYRPAVRSRIRTHVTSRYVAVNQCRFETSSACKIAVMVIDDHGDEVMKVVARMIVSRSSRPVTSR